jgi:hypothetical protein
MRSIKQLFGLRTEPVSDVESYLEYAFTPVTPRVEFVDMLRRSLRTQWDEPYEEPLSDSARTMLIGTAAFLAGTVALVMGIRAVITLLASLGLLHQMRKPRRKQSAPPLSPAA